MEEMKILFESENLKFIYCEKKYVILTPLVSINFDLLCCFKYESSLRLDVISSNISDTHYLNIDLDYSELKQFSNVLNGIIENKTNSLKKYGFELEDFSIVNND